MEDSAIEGRWPFDPFDEHQLPMAAVEEEVEESEGVLLTQTVSGEESDHAVMVCSPLVRAVSPEADLNEILFVVEDGDGLADELPSRLPQSLTAITVRC